MAAPIDVKEVLNAIADIDAARQQQVSVRVLLDPSSPDDLLDFARDSFATTEPNARVSYAYYVDANERAPFGTDLAVVFASLSEWTGQLASNLRASGVPVLVVTSMPEIAVDLAKAAAYPLLADDVVSPKPRPSQELDGNIEAGIEPYALNEARIASLKQQMGAWIVDVFREKRLAFALCFPFVRKPLSTEAVKATSMQNAGIGLVMIIPGADMPVMTLNQAKMLLQIAAAYGQKLGLERLKELAGVVAGGFACRAVARQAVGAVPGLGWAVKAGIGYTGTLAMGHAAIAYFEKTVGEGKPFAEAVQAAQDEAARVSAIAKEQGNPAAAVSAVARTYVGEAGERVRDVASRAVPAVQGLASNVAKAAYGLGGLASGRKGSASSVGSAANLADVVDAGKRVVDGISEATGMSPAELGKKAVETVLSARGKGK